jgi:GDP-L-fucose synthase
MDSDSKVLIAGANGMVGRAIVRNLESKGYGNIIRGTRSSVDFIDQEATDTYFRLKKPEYVFVAAAKVGGVFDNLNYPVEYLLNNLKIQNNIISTSCKYNVKKLIFFASSCVYSSKCSMPIREEDLLSGDLEKTNQFYAVAKIAGIKLCEAYKKEYGCDFISVNPCNIYGPENKIDPLKSHVMTSLIYKIWKAKRENISFVECFGDGSPKREFLYSDDLADAVIFLMNQNTESLINIGSGIEHSIMQISQLIAEIICYNGEIVWDTTKPNGASRRVLDISKLNSLGWFPKVSLEEGIAKVVNHLNQNYV